ASNQDADARLQALAPAPRVGPQAKPPDVVVEPRNGSLALNSNLAGEAPGVATRMPSVPEGQNTASRLSAIAETESIASVSRAPVNGRASIDAPTDSKEEAAMVIKDPVQVLRPSPPRGLNRMKPGQPDPNVRNRGALSLLSPQQAAPNPEPSPKPAENKSTSL